MPDPISGLISGGATLLGSMISADASQSASQAQVAASGAGIDEQRRQFNAIQSLLQPYVSRGTEALQGLQPFAQAGAPALRQQQALAGVLGPEEQQRAIQGISGSPEMQALIQQGENAILQNASATGGLRGGNTQAALAQFRPRVLADLINQRYSRLGGLTALGQGTTQNLAQLGQAAAAGQATAGLASGANIANLMGQQGAAQAGGILGQAAGTAGFLSSIPQGLGTFYGLTGRSPFGGSNVPQGVLNAANQTADPLGALIDAGVF